MIFHVISGARVTFSSDYKTASRNTQEFDHGIAFSSDPLQINVPFHMRVEKVSHSWSGSLEIGVTKCDPEYIDVPPSAMDMKNGTWLLSGRSVMKDGKAILTNYALDLYKIEEGDVVGVMRTERDELIFLHNGKPQGVAAENIPRRLFAVIDLFGQVLEATVIHNYVPPPSPQDSPTSDDPETFDSDMSEGQSIIAGLTHAMDMQMTASVENQIDRTPPAILMKFHPRCGNLARVSYNGRTAERIHSSDEFNNAVVLTHIPLIDDELFEIRIDKTVDKWSGSIEVGVTTHSPENLNFPSTMTNLKTGTVMMSGCGILTNGKASLRDYGQYNLDELLVGDRIGLIRKSNGNLHYVINGLDQGCAASFVPAGVYGVVDLYGRTVKVTIVEKDEREEHNLVERRRAISVNDHLERSITGMSEEEMNNRLTFHTRCGTNANIFNSNRSACRPNALDDFNNGVILTSRPMKTGELFEVRLDKTVAKWAGSIEIGVTTHAPTGLEFPSTMTNIRSGTWMMTGNGVMHNGSAILDDYGVNLDKLQVGDRVAVCIKEGGSLHFFVNGVDQGEAAVNMPPSLYGVIDLYGQAAQATIIDHTSCGCGSPTENQCNLPGYQHDLHFHHIHGKNVCICNGGRMAFRPYGLSEYSDSVVMSNRPLKNNEMFAIIVEKIFDRWHGSLEIGITTIDPNEMEIPTTMTEIDHDVWVLTGSSVMKDGTVVKGNYALNMETIQVGMIIGMMKHDDNTLHFYLDGVDQGEACGNIPSIIYPMIDLYGKCAQVSIVSPPEHKSDLYSNIDGESCSLPTLNEDENQQSVEDSAPNHFNTKCGENIVLSNGLTVAKRKDGYEFGIVLSKISLKRDEPFEVYITKWNNAYAGCLSIGVTTMYPDKSLIAHNMSHMMPDTWSLIGDEIRLNNRLVKAHYTRNIYWLRPGCKIGVKCCWDNTLHFLVNGRDQGIAAYNIPQTVYAVVDLFGSTVEISTLPPPNLEKMRQFGPIPYDRSYLPVSAINSFLREHLKENIPDNSKMERDIMENHLAINSTTEEGFSNKDKIKGNMIIEEDWTFFNEFRGRNIRFTNNNRTASRIESYNQGLVICSKPLVKNTLIQVVIEKLNAKWTSSLMIGIICSPPLRSILPVTAFGFRKDAWLVAADSVYRNGIKIQSLKDVNLDKLNVHRRVGLLMDSSNNLHLYIDGLDYATIAYNVPLASYLIVDVYGRCEQVSMHTGFGCLEKLTESCEDHKKDLNIALLSFEKADCERSEKGSPEDSSVNGEGSANQLVEIPLTSEEDEDGENNAEMSWTNCDHKTSLNIANANRILANIPKLFRYTPPKTSSIPSFFKSLAEKSLDTNKSLSNCKYRHIAYRLRSFINLPDKYFECNANCYCKNCIGLITEKRPGITPGWIRFPTADFNMSLELPDKWKTVYYGTSIGFLRKILDHKQLLPQGISVFDFENDKESINKNGPIIFSTGVTEEYVNKFSPTYRYRDFIKREYFDCRAVFEISVEICSSTTYKKIENNEETSLWFTLNNKPNIVITALLLQLSEPL